MIPTDKPTEALRLARDALQAMMDSWLDYHDSHSLTEPVTGASGNAFDKALVARDSIDEALRSSAPQEPVADDDALIVEHEALKHDFERLADRENHYLNESERFADALVQIRDLSGKNYDSDRAWALAMQLRASVALKGWMGLQAKAPETGEE